MYSCFNSYLLLKQQVSVTQGTVTVLDESFEGGTKARLNQLGSLIYIKIATTVYCVFENKAHYLRENNQIISPKGGNNFTQVEPLL